MFCGQEAIIYVVVVELKMGNEGGVFRGLRPGQGMASQVSRGGDLVETGPSERRRDSPHVLPVCCELGQRQPDLMLGCRNKGRTAAWSRHQVFMSLAVPYSHTRQPQSLWAFVVQQREGRSILDMAVQSTAQHSL